MRPQSPFSFGAPFSGPIPVQAPQWLVDDLQQRLLLLVNHVLAQEPEAMRRLSRVKGQRLLLRWRHFSLTLLVTPVGLFDRASADVAADLMLTLAEESPLLLVQMALRGDKPAVQIEGDVLLAAEINWLVDHVRWDLEEDLSRLVGDVPARVLGQVAEKLLAALREFVGKSNSGPPGAEP